MEPRGFSKPTRINGLPEAQIVVPERKHRHTRQIVGHGENWRLLTGKEFPQEEIELRVPVGSRSR